MNCLAQRADNNNNHTMAIIINLLNRNVARTLATIKHRQKCSLAYTRKHEYALRICNAFTNMKIQCAFT